jgi:hypothetical protein
VKNGKLTPTPNPEAARSALRALFEESDSWADYTEDYENMMRVYTWCLFVATTILPLLAVFAFHAAGGG